MKRKKGREGKGKEEMGNKKGRGKVKREREGERMRGGEGRGLQCVEIYKFCLKRFIFEVSKIKGQRSKVMAIIC